MYHDGKPRQTETLWAKYRAKNKQNHNTKKVIEKEKKTKYKKDWAYVHIVTTFTSDSTMDNGSVHTFPALRV